MKDIEQAWLIAIGELCMECKSQIIQPTIATTDGRCSECIYGLAQVKYKRYNVKIV